MLALQHRRNALEAHARIYGGLGKGMQHALLIAVELHEHEIPDFDVAVAVGVGRARRTAFDARAMVIEDLAARPAGAGVGHLPEVVRLVLLALVADAYDTVCGQTDHLRPQRVGFVVGVVHRGPQAARIQLVDLGQQLPGELDRVLLEVVAEREVAEHLEKGVMSRGIADVLEIVVLAACAHRALRSRRAHIRPLFLSQEHVLELHHARVDEQQRRVARRHERTRRHHGMALGAEVLEKAGANLT
jgi:hypothetical protein